jgi:hypothetical protein
VSNINYAIFDKTGCIPKSDANSNHNVANSVDDHVSTNNDQAAAALFEQNQAKEGSLLKKRAHAISKLSALNNEFNDEF